MGQKESDLIEVKFATEEIVTPVYLVEDFLTQIDRTKRANSYEYMLDSLLSDLPIYIAKKANEVLADRILSHYYGEILAIEFRAWIRSFHREECYMPCGGASIERADIGLF